MSTTAAVPRQKSYLSSMGCLHSYLHSVKELWYKQSTVMRLTLNPAHFLISDPRSSVA